MRLGATFGVNSNRKDALTATTPAPLATGTTAEAPVSRDCNSFASARVKGLPALGGPPKPPGPRPPGISGLPDPL